MQNIIALFVTRHTSYAFYNDFVNNLKMMKIEEYIWFFIFFPPSQDSEKRLSIFLGTSEAIEYIQSFKEF